MLLALKEGWSDEVLSELSAAPVDEYRRAFQETTGRELRKMLAGALQFERIINASPEMKEVSKRAREALKIILITHELQPALAGDTALEGFVPRPTRGAGSWRRDRICG
jgi:hypothetical protein